MSRKIESDILNAFRHGKHFSRGPLLHASSWRRDTVEWSEDLDSEPQMLYFLHGTAVARLRVSSRVLELGVDGGAWQTVTTKSRINAFADFHHVPRIYQENYEWTWSDGVPYIGTRSFKLDDYWKEAGEEGQDRESYTDEQDRESYAPEVRA